MFRVSVGYGPKGNLILRIDGPTGVALQKGLEFSPRAVKIYRLPFQTCVPQGCSAVLLIGDDLKQDLQTSDKGTITVYALNGQAVQAPTQLAGFADGLAALDKRLGQALSEALPRIASAIVVRPFPIIVGTGRCLAGETWRTRRTRAHGKGKAEPAGVPAKPSRLRPR